MNGASFFTTDIARIFARIGCEDINSINLGGIGSINGGMVLFRAISVSIGEGITAGGVSVTGGNIVLSGTVPSLYSYRIGTVSVN